MACAGNANNKFMKNKKIIIIIVSVVLLAALFLFLFFQKERKSVPDGDRKLKVVVTIFPLFDMARALGGDQAEVYQLLPPGMEAHAFDPKPNDMVKIHEADIFVYTGDFMEPWAADIIKSLPEDGPIIVNASEGATLIEGGDEHEDEGGHVEEEGQEHIFDPHIWLDFDNAALMTDNIAKAFVAVSPIDSEIYLQRATQYKDALNSWDNKYRDVLSGCRYKHIVYGGHYAFGYLASRYGLFYEAAQGFSPDSEPSAKDMIALSKQLKSEGISYIFYEEISSPKVAETIAKESGAGLLLLNAAHNLAKDQFESGISFFDIMENNLANLKIGLECK